MSHKKNKKNKKIKKIVKRNPYQKRKHIVKRKTKKVKKLKKSSTELKSKFNKIGKDRLPKRPRGRPRKDASHTPNDAITGIVKETGKKRGRPKNTAPTEYKREEPIIVLKPMKILKFIGYCPACQLSLTNHDKTGDKVTCSKCEKICNETELLKEIPRREEAKSKREYLQTINSTSYSDYYKPINVDTKEIIDNTDEEDAVEKTEKVESIDEVDPIEEVDLDEAIDVNDPADAAENLDSTIIKSDEDLTIEKHIKNYLDKDDEE